VSRSDLVVRALLGFGGEWGRGASRGLRSGLGGVWLVLGVCRGESSLGGCRGGGGYLGWCSCCGVLSLSGGEALRLLMVGRRGVGWGFWVFGVVGCVWWLFGGVGFKLLWSTVRGWKW